MNFDQFWEYLDGALQYLSNGGVFLKSFYDCLPSEVTTFMLAVFVIPFGIMTVLAVINILK